MLEGRGAVVQRMAVQAYGRMAGQRGGRFHSAPVGVVFLARTRLGSFTLA